MSKSKRIRQKGFEDRNLSLIKEHKIKKENGKKKMVPPLMQIEGVHLVSWADDKLPNMLWAALILEALPREEALNLFRRVIAKARNFINREDVFIQHTDLAKLTEVDFDTIMSDVLKHKKVTEALSNLLLFEELPDRLHWERHIQKNNENKGYDLPKAIFPCLDAKSQETTDIAWLKVSFMVVQQRIYFPAPEATKDGHDLVAEICGYPNVGDMCAVRPSIRCFEQAIQINEETKAWADTFWSLCWEGSDPYPTRDFRSKRMYDTKPIINELIARQQRIEENFYRTSSYKLSDARHYLMHMLVSYVLYQCIAICRGDIHRRAESIILLRVMAETVLTFSYLYKRDQDELWTSYEEYGRGKAKEAFIKCLEMDEVPRFVDMKELDMLVNEVRWLEFQSIDLSHWDKTNLRKMSEECGLKVLYDKYYIIPSAYIHAHWTALDSLLLCFNLNPLHRHKKIMFGMNLRYKSTIYDALVLLNSGLEIFNREYKELDLMFPEKRLEEIKKELDEYDRLVEEED